MNEKLFDGLIDRLNDWVIDWLIAGWIHWLINSFVQERIEAIILWVAEIALKLKQIAFEHTRMG